MQQSQIATKPFWPGSRPSSWPRSWPAWQSSYLWALFVQMSRAEMTLFRIWYCFLSSSWLSLSEIKMLSADTYDVTFLNTATVYNQLQNSLQQAGIKMQWLNCLLFGHQNVQKQACSDHSWHRALCESSWPVLQGCSSLFKLQNLTTFKAVQASCRILQQPEKVHKAVLTKAWKDF